MICTCTADIMRGYDDGGGAERKQCATLILQYYYNIVKRHYLLSGNASKFYLAESRAFCMLSTS